MISHSVNVWGNKYHSLIDIPVYCLYTSTQTAHQKTATASSPTTTEIITIMLLNSIESSHPHQLYSMIRTVVHTIYMFPTRTSKQTAHHFAHPFTFPLKQCGWWTKWMGCEGCASKKRWMAFDAGMNGTFDTQDEAYADVMLIRIFRSEQNWMEMMDLQSKLFKYAAFQPFQHIMLAENIA